MNSLKATSIYPVTEEPFFHFFGYYDKHVWDSAGRWLLANRVSPGWEFPTPHDVCTVGAIDLESREFVEIGHTSSWNWQMGCMLQWCEWEREPTVLYNERRGDGFGATIRRLDGLLLHQLDRPVYGLAPNGSYALSVNFPRFMRVHPTIGYRSQVEPELELLPRDDGIWSQDLGGSATLIVSLQDLADFKAAASREGAIHWVTHLAVSPSGSRILFIHRWTTRIEDETYWIHRLYCCRPDGSELTLLEDGEHEIAPCGDADSVRNRDTYEYEKGQWQISHPLWRSDDEIICWSPHAGEIHYHLYDVTNGDVHVIGDGVLTENGHMSYSPCGRWILSDTYPDPVTHERILFLFDTETSVRRDIGSFYADPAVDKHCRCDLHPRWSRDSTQVCIDSIHESVRQMYILDVSGIIMNRS